MGLIALAGGAVHLMWRLLALSSFEGGLSNGRSRSSAPCRVINTLHVTCALVSADVYQRCLKLQPIPHAVHRNNRFAIRAYDLELAA
jgi:hypothetical protein